jgi:cytochrome P450
LTIAFNLLKTKLRIQFYQKQGLKAYFFPTMGFFNFLSRKHPENAKHNLGKCVAELSKDPFAPGVIYNRIDGAGCLLHLHNPEYVKEFFSKEDLFQKVALEKNMDWLTSFFYYSNEKSARFKRIFANLFHYPNLVKFTPMMCDTMNQEAQNLIKNRGITAESFTRVNLKEYYGVVFEKVLSIILFGSPTLHYGKSGKTMCQLMMSWIAVVPSLRSHPLYVLMPYLTSKFNLLQCQKDILAINAEISEILVKMYKKREAEGDLGDSAFDQMILHNQRCKKEGNMEDYMDEKVILGTANILQIAGTDTTQNTSTMSLCFIAEHPEHQKIFEQINSRIYDEKGMIKDNALDTDAQLESWSKEALRLFNPATRSMARYALQDVKLKDLTIKKDDLVVVNTFFMRTSEHYFKNATEFDQSRFEKPIDRDLDRYAYMPFYQGKRMCMGKHLGEMMLKLCITQFLRHFEIRKPADVEYYQDHFMLSFETNPIVEVRLRSLQTK